MYGIASQRYENRRNILENKVNIVIAQLDTPYTKKIIARIPSLQKKHCPIKPEVKNPLSIIRSLFGEEEPNDEITEDLKEIIIDRKNDLEGVVLMGINLEETNLAEVQLKGSNLKDANLEKTDLSKGNLEGCILSYANLRGAILLFDANLKRAVLWRTILEDAHLDFACLEGADLTGAYLKNASLIGAKINKDTNFRDADLENTIWINGKKCEKGSIGKCIQDGKELDFKDFYK
ncbi:MAG: pentapeptide repeat-containing protein [Planctomycetes bacterium]|nr:pentapeptide repeat-containing protein [Planctomycetota bacterium]